MGLRDKFKKIDKDRVREQMKAYSESRDSTKMYTTYFELADGMPQFLWKATKEGSLYRYDTIPFIVSAEYPFPDHTKVFRSSSAIPKPGEFWFCVELCIHENVGPDNERVVCPLNSFRTGIAKGDKPGCPICEDREYRQELIRGDKEAHSKIWQELKFKRRNLYNIVVRDDGEEEDKGVQLFEVAFDYIQKQIKNLTEDEDDGLDTWWDIDEGKQIQFKAFERGGNPPEFVGVKFRDRKNYVISEEEMEESITPQKWIKYYSYDELYELYYQKPYAEGSKKGDEEDPPVTSRRNRRDKAQKSNPVLAEADEDIPFENAEDKQSLNECTFGHIFGEDPGSFDECQDDCPNDTYKACLSAKVALGNTVKEEDPPPVESTRKSRRSRK